MADIYNINQYRSAKNHTIDKLLKDKNLYFELTPEEKYNYEIIKNIFDYFYDDTDFLDKVYSDIRRNVKADWPFEFILRMRDIKNSEQGYNIGDYINNPSDILIKSTQLESTVVQIAVELKTEGILMRVRNVLEMDDTPNLGLGFAIIEYMFHYSEIVLNYFAKYFISKIFLELDVEKYLHERYENFEDFEAHHNLKRFIIDQIALRDISLYYYSIKNPEVLKEATFALDYVKRAWTHYINQETENIYSIISSKIIEYIDKMKENNDVDNLWDTAFLIAYENGIFDEVLHHTPYTIDMDEESLEMRRQKYQQYNQKNFDYHKIHYQYLKKLVRKNLNQITDKGYKKKLYSKIQNQ